MTVALSNPNADVCRPKTKWGYINRKGQFVIPPQWDTASDFSNGYALVSIAPVFNPNTYDWIHGGGGCDDPPRIKAIINTKGQSVAQIKGTVTPPAMTKAEATEYANSIIRAAAKGHYSPVDAKTLESLKIYSAYKEKYRGKAKNDPKPKRKSDPNEQFHFMAKNGPASFNSAFIDKEGFMKWCGDNLFTDEENPNHLCGFISTKNGGEWEIKPMCNQMGDFHEGLARCGINK